MKQSESVAKISAAIALAQGEITHAAKGSNNPFYNSKYADLASVIEACKLPLAKNGIAYVQGLRTRIDEKTRDAYAIVETQLSHESGEWITSEIELPVLPSIVSKGSPPIVTAQGFGSAFTYGRRYGLCAAVGIAQADDDANGAGKPGIIDEAKKMEESLFANHQAALEAADTMETLRDTWLKANEACGEDQDALRAMTAIKEGMKKKISDATKGKKS